MDIVIFIILLWGAFLLGAPGVFGLLEALREKPNNRLMSFTLSLLYAVSGLLLAVAAIAVLYLHVL